MLGCLGAEMRLLVSYRPLGIINPHILLPFCVTLYLGRGKHTRRQIVVECYEYKAAECTWRTQFNKLCSKTAARASTTPSSARDTYIQRVYAPRPICFAVAPPPRHM